jgi:hypothetical protein
MPFAIQNPETEDCWHNLEGGVRVFDSRRAAEQAIDEARAEGELGEVEVIEIPALVEVDIRVRVAANYQSEILYNAARMLDLKPYESVVRVKTRDESGDPTQKRARRPRRRC